MHTTSLAREPIGRLYEGDRLAEALRDARARTLAIYGHLELESLEVPWMPTVNPPLWELAHIAWFQEYWCRRHSPEAGSVVRPSLLTGADSLFDSTNVTHRSRWHLEYPPERALRGYMKDTLDATLEALVAVREERYFFELALLHEDMHGEALLMTLQTLGLPGPGIEAREPGAGMPPAARDVAFEAGEFSQGTQHGSEAFIFDNEKWAHPVRLAPFAISSAPTTQGEFAAFVDDGGYARRELWTDAGWSWRERQGLQAPRHWARADSRWSVRRFDRWVPLEAHLPMVHVCLHEALAWCRWAGRRLPTEAEWEYAARNGGRDDRYPWGSAPIADNPALDLRYSAPCFVPSESTRSRRGLDQLLGGVWEWTSSRFDPYPGFSADPYKEYSAPWFHTHHVLRGGSFATRARLIHNRFRNFYLPERSDVFAGFRTCAGKDAIAVS